MDSEMVQNWTSHFSITFNKHDQIQPKKCKKTSTDGKNLIGLNILRP